MAAGNQIFVYRYLRPHLKYSLPKVEIHQKEFVIWDNMKAADEQSMQTGMDALNALRGSSCKYAGWLWLAHVENIVLSTTKSV